MEVHKIKIEIAVSLNYTDPVRYNANVSQFLHEISFGTLSIQSLVSAIAASGAYTPNQSPLRNKRGTVG
jgi:hypothetical protein